DLLACLKPSINSFHVCKKLGKASDCKKFKCLISGSKCAVKCIPLRASCFEEPREVNIISSLRNGRIMMLFQVETFRRDSKVSKHCIVNLLFTGILSQITYSWALIMKSELETLEMPVVAKTSLENMAVRLIVAQKVIWRQSLTVMRR
uniref:Uncharacterized protein n=1 Tax=Aegilops tauschii subsp. strangulata TaxID=200361 RepID=A0A453T0N7_AEGTS